jgi:Domain of unknown function (DUF5004)
VVVYNKSIKIYDMKNVLSILLLMAVAMVACKPEAIKDYEASNSNFKVSDLSGTWKCTSITQTDEDAVRKGFPYKALDVTNSINATQLKFIINMSGANPGQFTIDHGTGIKLFKSTAGNWLTNATNKPSQMWFVNNLDTVKFTIIDYNNFAQNKMVLKRDRTFNGKVVSTYTYSFSK